MKKTTRLSIWINRKPVLQGKFYYLGNKAIFLVNVDEHKVWKKFNGFSIATQILEGFRKGKVRPLILYKHVEKNLIYQAVPSDFYKHGIPVKYGGHRQMILPFVSWKFFKEAINEPFDLPAMTLDEWLGENNKEPQSVKIDSGVKNRLKADFLKKYPEFRHG